MPYPDYTSLPQYANIVSLWKLDELSGTRSDTIASNNLVDNNTVLYGTGKISNAADFELDTSEYLSITDALQTGLDITGDITICAWIKLETNNIKQSILSKWNDAANRSYFLFVNVTTNTLVFQATDDGGWNAGHYINVATTGTFNTATWYHVGVTFNAATQKISLFINGSVDLDEAATNISSIYNSTAAFAIGRFAGGSYFDGLIDEVIVWNVALSSAEVSTLYNWYSKAGFSGAISFVGTLSSQTIFHKLLEGTISFIGTLQRLPKKTLSGAISFTGTLGKLPKKLLTGAITFTGTLITKVKKILTGSISFIGQIFSPYLDGIWSLFIKRTTSWTGQDKETTTWTAQDKEDTDWTTT